MGYRMKITPTALPGVMVVESDSIDDSRGAFMRLYCERELASLVGERKIRQINQSRTGAIGAVRGMHYQHAPAAEMKLVRCAKGRVWDVAVDLRAGSPTFLRWQAVELTPANARMIVIPEGCAHGFQALESDSELLYLHTAFYTPSAEGGVSCTDSQLNISWPLPVGDLSPRDRHHPPLQSDFAGLVV